MQSDKVLYKKHISNWIKDSFWFHENQDCSTAGIDTIVFILHTYMYRFLQWLMISDTIIWQKQKHPFAWDPWEPFSANI